MAKSVAGALDRLSHLAVRLIAGANITEFALEMMFPQYWRRVANGPLDRIILRWFFASSILLPLYVGLEFLWMRRAKIGTKALLIDAAFAVAWLFVWWGGLFYAFTHYGIV
jgi:hypothetical protein